MCDFYKSKGMYELEVISSKQIESQRKCLSKLSSLSLIKGEASNHDIAEKTEDDRPTTPINDSISAPPKTFSVLCKHVRRRINPRPNWDHISVEDQRSLAAVLIGEVASVWSMFRRQVEDPFLTQMQNKELQRRITVHIVTVCEQLFLYYCNQLKELNSRGVFSESANMCRLRGQIAVDADKFLNLLAVRRHIISDLRMTQEDKVKAKSTVTLTRPQVPRNLSFRSLIAKSRPKKQVHSFNIAQEIKDMKRQMPSIDISLTYALLPAKREHQDEINERDAEALVIPQETEPSARNIVPIRELRKWCSEPTLALEGLFENVKEREEQESPYAPSRLMSTPKNPPSSAQHPARVITSAPQTARPVYAAIKTAEHIALTPRQDLANLIAQRNKDHGSEENLEDKGMPPLIQAITRTQMQDEKLRQLRKDEKELDDRIKLLDEEDLPPAPEHPQPPVVEVKLPGYTNPIDKSAIVIRTSDIHIPDKVDLPEASLEMHGPLYNDLIGEISPATVKELDANLFQGEELTDVYGEIMKTVPDDHLKFDADDMVMKPATAVDINKVLASTTLSRPRSQQLINPDLKKCWNLPPWNGDGAWDKNNRPLLPISGSDSVATSRRQSMQVDKSTRAYASWLAWWKATINTDDYFKYLGTQETDFLGVIYHFYDSEATESEVESLKTARLEAEKKREEFLSEIKAKKEHFVRGVWNVNAVMLGGLGKYPSIEETETEEQSEKAPTVAESVDESCISSLPKLPQLSDESADSESSFYDDISPRRKSVSPRRKLKARHKFSYSGTSDEESTTELSQESLSSSTDAITASSDQQTTSSSFTLSNETASSEKTQPSKSTFSSITTESSASANDSASKTSTDDDDHATSSSTTSDYLVPKPPGASKKKERKMLESQHQESGISCTETDDSANANKGSSGNTRMPKERSQDYTSGYMSVETDTISKVQMKKKLMSRQRSSKSANFKAPITTMYKKQWKVSEAETGKKTINLLKGYYKKSASQTVTLSPCDVPEEKPVSLQSRLEAVWKKLKMTSSQKLDAALKYSDDQHLPLLPDIVSSWEQVANLIQKREKILHDLEVFERAGSDPHRFFQKGAKGSSLVRLQEAKSRASIYQKLERLEKAIGPMLHSIYTNYRDIVTFEGRPYHEKMNLDKVEMLYWLQQERRCISLHEQGHPNQLRHFMRDNNVVVTTLPAKNLTMPVTAVDVKKT